MEEKKNCQCLLHKLCDFRCLISRPQSKLNSKVTKSNSNILMRNYFVLKNYVTSEGVVSHNVLFYQQLSMTLYQVRFYANNYFE